MRATSSGVRTTWKVGGEGLAAPDPHAAGRACPALAPLGHRIPWGGCAGNGARAGHLGREKNFSAARLKTCYNGFMQPPEIDPTLPTPGRAYTKKPPIERFKKLYIVHEESNCFVWQGHLSNGYGQFYLEGKNYAAHRVAWYFEHGEWPPPWPESGMVLNHTCHNSACVNPAHLELITHKENLVLKAMGPVESRRATRPKKNQHCNCCADYKFDGTTKQYINR